jgi:predicted DNA-binding transcriptional regulator AlpA
MRPIHERLEAARRSDFVTVEDFSLLSGISERTIWRRIKAGVFPTLLRNGGIVRIHRLSALRALKPAQPEGQP